mmetsp:Transcript_57967/g.131045  ORF Transcript_57967/g.131045 Transcript_57967/m.131045 type:complete len:646 (+) Transcript_57967:95-2032(+)
MGFRFIAEQNAQEDLARQSTGAYLLFAGAWLCWHAMVLSKDAWWRDPVNTAKYAQIYRKTGKWVSFIENHPATISEMIGEQQKAQGAVAAAICLPACMLTLIGGFMVNQAYPISSNQDGEAMYFANMVRSVLMPVGFLLVLNTPIVSLDRNAYGQKKREWAERSEIEDEWHAQHHNVHAGGFVLAVVVPILWEAGFLISDIHWYLGGVPSGLPWPRPARVAWLVLTFLRSAALIMQTICTKKFLALETGAVEPKNPKLVNFRQWSAEYSCLVLGGLVVMYNAASILVFAGHTPTSSHHWLRACLISGVLLEILRCTVGFLGLAGYRWSGLTALLDFDGVDFEGVIHYIFNVYCVPPLLRSLKYKSGADLLCIDVAQAGDRSPFALMPHDLGANLPELQILLACPGLVEEVTAIHFHQLSQIDLKLYHEDLAKVLQQLPSIEEIRIPFGGQVFKCGRRLPLAILKLANYREDLAALRAGVVPNAEPTCEWSTSWASLRALAAKAGITMKHLRINSTAFGPWRKDIWESLGREDVARDVTQVVRRRLPHLGIWTKGLLAQLESGEDLIALYKLFFDELAPLEEYEVRIRGLVAGSPQFTAVTLRENLVSMEKSPLWMQGYETSVDTGLEDSTDDSDLETAACLGMQN